MISEIESNKGGKLRDSKVYRYEQLVGGKDATILPFLCQLCGDLLNLKHSNCLGCYNYFCTKCIDQKPCPLCKSKEIVPSTDKVQELGNLWLFCKNLPFGCEESSGYANLEDHENNKCVFAMINCPRCEKFVSKKKHTNELCAHGLYEEIGKLKPLALKVSKEQKEVLNVQGEVSKYDKEIASLQTKISSLKVGIEKTRESNPNKMEFVDTLMSDTIIAKKQERRELEAQVKMYKDLLKIEFNEK